jgi:hypothetical protein
MFKHMNFGFQATDFTLFAMIVGSDGFRGGAGGGAEGAGGRGANWGCRAIFGTT